MESVPDMHQKINKKYYIPGHAPLAVTNFTNYSFFLRASELYSHFDNHCFILTFKGIYLPLEIDAFEGQNFATKKLNATWLRISRSEHE